MDIRSHRETHVHLHCEELKSICVTNRMLSFTTANGDAVMLHLSYQQMEDFTKEVKQELAAAWES